MHDQNALGPRPGADQPEFTIVVDADMFPQSVILRTAYWLAAAGDFTFETDNKAVVVRVRPKAGYTTDQIRTQFQTGLIDFCIRYDLEKRFDVVRTTIWKTAFAELRGSNAAR